VASKTSGANDVKECVIDMVAFAPALARHREVAGNPALPRNTRNRRTVSKRALFSTIEGARGIW